MTKRDEYMKQLTITLQQLSTADDYRKVLKLSKQAKDYISRIGYEKIDEIERNSQYPDD